MNTPPCPAPGQLTYMLGHQERLPHPVSPTPTLDCVGAGRGPTPPLHSLQGTFQNAKTIPDPGAALLSSGHRSSQGHEGA